MSELIGFSRTCPERFAANALIACLLLAVTVAPLSIASQDKTDSAELSRAEELVFGKSRADLSEVARLESLEKMLVGKTQLGSTNVRLQKINQILGLTNKDGSKGTAALPAKKPLQESESEEPPLAPDRHARAPAASSVRGTNRSVTSSVAGTDAADTSRPAVSAVAASAHLSKTSHSKAMPEAKAGPSASNSAHLSAPLASYGNPSAAAGEPQAVSTKQLLQLGARRFREGDTLGADACFRRVLVIDPSNVDALYNLGALSERRGDLVSALGSYQAALRLKPNDADLKVAVESVEGQFSRRAGNKGPLIGGAQYTASLAQPTFSAQQPQYGSVQPSYPNTVLVRNPQGNYPLIPVQVPQPPSIKVGQNQPQRHVARQAFTSVLHVGLGQVPFLRGLSCPICETINNF